MQTIYNIKKKNKQTFIQITDLSVKHGLYKHPLLPRKSFGAPREKIM